MEELKIVIEVTSTGDSANMVARLHSHLFGDKELFEGAKCTTIWLPGNTIEMVVKEKMTNMMDEALLGLKKGIKL